jgi:hypothetical protein
MFDLDREVATWVRRAYAGRCRERAASAAELEDHLRCEIERLEGEGLPREEAFRRATGKLEAAVGEPPAGRRRAARWVMIAHGVVWAALILSLALDFHRRGDANGFSLLLITLLVPLWYASNLVVRRALRVSDGR